MKTLRLKLDKSIDMGAIIDKNSMKISRMVSQSNGKVYQADMHYPKKAVFLPTLITDLHCRSTDAGRNLWSSTGKHNF